MIAITDVIFFLISFACIFAAFKLSSTEEVSAEKAALTRRINTLAKQQDALLEASGSKMSTFTQIKKSEFGGDIESDHGLIERVRVIMKKASITDISVVQFMLMCFVGGVIFATGIVYFEFLNILTGVPIGMFVGAYLVYSYLSSQAQNKKMQFLQQFPDAIDMMIRGVKAGLNISRIMKLVSMEARDPLAAEFRTISQKFDLGIEPEKVLVEAADRIDIEEFRFLVVALVLQLENGGVLGDILANLAGVVRKRLELGLKLKAMSAEARMSAIVISALPFVFGGIMALVSPEHLSEFTKPGSGQTLLKVGLTLFSMGTFFMLKATKIKV